MPPGRGKGLLQGVQFGRGHANIDGAVGEIQDIAAGLLQEGLEL